MSDVLVVGSAEWIAQVGLSAVDTCRKAQFDLAARDARILSLEADLGDFGGLPFQAEFPDRFYDFGIAEASMMGAAAGFALRGKIPFVNTFGTFALMRAAEQVRIDLCYHNLPVKIAGTFAGVGAGFSGPTHHAIEDLAIARALPNMTVIAPSDAISAYHATMQAASLPGPVYIRLGLDVTPQVYGTDCPFQIGKGIELAEGSDLTIVASGFTTVSNALAARELLLKDGVKARVIDLHTIKPIDREILVKAARETGAVLTVEEHSLCGGVGSAVAEVLAAEFPVPMQFLGLPDAFAKDVGPYEYHLQKAGIDAEGIRRGAHALLAKRG